jgi:hypothetical protein
MLPSITSVHVIRTTTWKPLRRPSTHPSPPPTSSRMHSTRRCHSPPPKLPSLPPCAPSCTEPLFSGVSLSLLEARTCRAPQYHLFRLQCPPWLFPIAGAAFIASLHATHLQQARLYPSTRMRTSAHLQPDTDHPDVLSTWAAHQQTLFCSVAICQSSPLSLMSATASGLAKQQRTRQEPQLG